MDVFLIPLGADRHELYCEASHSEAEPEEETSARRGPIARLKQHFSEVIAAAERDRRSRASGENCPPAGWWERLKCRALAWIADAIAEQRLLWHLRHQQTARLHYPPDLGPDRALELARGALTRDRDRHWFWLIVDSVLMILSLALVLVPGPNFIGYYFLFRVVGHFLAWRGAKQGLERVTWELVPSEPLAELRRAISLAPVQRERHVHEIAARLELNDLPTFVERVAWPGA